MKNVFEAADARQKQAKKRSLCIINEHFEPVFNAAMATQVVFQLLARAAAISLTVLRAVRVTPIRVAEAAPVHSP